MNLMDGRKHDPFITHLLQDREPSRRVRRTMVRLTVKPRVQKDKWSLYWKTSMMTKTEMLDEIVLEVADPSAMTGAQLKAAVRTSPS